MTTAVPAVVEDNAIENVVVERFMEASRELVPHVQVSLAKKMILRGSNQVVCLAAHTSVPLNEDELASFSELALRLADGTNVVLNLSFFNDQDGGQFVPNQYIPYDRCIYDPNRYVVRGQPKLGFVVFLIAALAIGGFYYVTNVKPNQSDKNVATASMIPSVSKGAAHKSARKVAATKQAKKPVSEVSKPSLPLTAKANSSPVRHRSVEPKPQNVQNVQNGQNVQNVQNIRRHSSASTSNSGMFGLSGMVPPPPPNTYSLPSIYEYAPFNPMQPVPAASQRTAKPVHHSATKPEVRAAPRSLELPAAAPVITQIPAAPTTSAPAAVEVPPVAVQAQHYEPIQLERIQTVNGIAPLAAPLPGNTPPLHLERLTP